MGTCGRDTDGVVCGSLVRGPWGDCMDYTGTCDDTGTRRRTITDRVCASGACTDSERIETGACSRVVAAGTPCDVDSVCCGSTCTDVTTDSNCGACGLNCGSVGLRCLSVSRGRGFSCGPCTANSTCQRLLGSAATCYDTTSPPAVCNCQCASPTTGVCPDAGCGPGMYCYDCPGLNYCSPVAPAGSGCP